MRFSYKRNIQGAETITKKRPMERTTARKKAGAKEKGVSFRVQPHIIEKLKELAAEDGVSASQWVRTRIVWSFEALQKKRAREAMLTTPTEPKVTTDANRGDYDGN